MPLPRVASLKRLLLVHELTFLLLVVVTGTLGGLWAYFWHDTTAESVRINQMYYAAQQVRGDLFRQIKDVYMAKLLEDPAAMRAYSDYSRRIDRHFNVLRRRSTSRTEDQAVQAMQQAYRVIQKDMNKIFADPYLVSRMARMRILDPSEEKNFVGVFEDAFRQIETLLTAHQRELEATMDRWTRLAPVAVPLPILLAVALLAKSRRSVREGFVEPMAAVMAGARRMSEGKLDEPIAAAGVQEVADLGRAINHVAAELAASQEALVEQERQAALGALVPVIAHNIRNPLATIRASAQLMDHADGPGEIGEIRQGIIDTVDRLGRWVTALVAYLHPLKPHLVPVRPGVFLDAALSLLGPRLAEKGIRVVKKGWDGSCEVMVDCDLMEQALYGLLSNAVDASADGADIVLGIDRAADSVRISITDHGPGMPFAPEPNGLSPGPSTKRFGTGLGIPVAFKVCRAHGWQLTFETARAQGTRVVLSAPVS